MNEAEAERFQTIQSGGTAAAPAIRKLVAEALEGGTERLLFIGTGGASILMQPAVTVMEQASTFDTRLLMAAELVQSASPLVNETALVVMPSLSGTTPETLQALDYCRRQGARVVALTGRGDSPLAEGADVVFENGAADDTSSELFELQSLLFALAVMDARRELEAGQIFAEIELLPQLLVDAKRQYERLARPVAENIAAEPWHIISGAGLTWPAAFYYGMCILEEMQWIRTRPVHSSDFFHGTLELVEHGVSVILLKGEDSGRALVERVERFVPRHSHAPIVLDSAEIELPGISDRTRKLISSVILATMLERVSAELEVIRDHPLTTRRYYRRTDY